MLFSRVRQPGPTSSPIRLPRVPHSIVDAIAELEASAIAADAFGADVHEHLVNTAHQEWLAFGGVVTDWERRRCFEQF